MKKLKKHLIKSRFLSSLLTSLSIIQLIMKKSEKKKGEHMHIRERFLSRKRKNILGMPVTLSVSLYIKRYVVCFDMSIKKQKTSVIFHPIDN